MRISNYFYKEHGMKQKLCILSVLHCTSNSSRPDSFPPILTMDSPFTVLVEFNEFCLLHFSFILHAKKTGFVVEHDFIMATYLADRVVVFEGEPTIKTLANT